MATSVKRNFLYNQPDSLANAFDVLRLQPSLDVPSSYIETSSTSNDLETDSCSEQTVLQQNSSPNLSLNSLTSRFTGSDISQNSMQSGMSSFYSCESTIASSLQQRQQQQLQSRESVSEYSQSHQPMGNLWQQQHQQPQQPQQSRQPFQPENQYPWQTTSGQYQTQNYRGRMPSDQEQNYIQEQQQQQQQQQQSRQSFQPENQRPWQTTSGQYQTQQGQYQSPSYQGTSSQRSTANSVGSMSTPLGGSRYPNYTNTAVRRATFNCWSSRLKPSKLMAEAGFFSTKNDDSVRCFHCGIGLRNWDPEDDPWVEHARWAPKCRYVQREKGQDFINLVQAAVRQAEMEEALQENASMYPSQTRSQGQSSQTPNDIEADGSRPQKGKKANKENKSSSKFTADDKKNPLLTSCAQSVLAMGYRPKTVKKAIDRVIENKGWDELSGENIMKVIFDMEENGEMDSEDDQVTAKQTPTVQTKDTAETLDRTKLMAENEELKDRTRCKICCENSVSIVFLPCGHLVCCAQCAPALKTCAICRKGIKGTVRVCLS